MVHRLERLRHDAVVGGHHQHDDVGDLGAAGAHQREGLVARRVEEHDAPRADVHVVGADVLRDPAGFARRHCSSARIASSSDVLPWSTWPMTVITGARGTRSSGFDSTSPTLNCSSSKDWICAS